MNKINIFIVNLMFIFGLSFVPVSVGMVQAHDTSATGQMMIGTDTSSATTTTADEEKQGAAIWAQLQSKQVTCAQLTNDQFELLGDYFMGVMMGSSHAAMDQMMENSLGADGNTQMHIAMAKRLSGCEPSAAYPVGGTGFMPMMMGGGSMQFGWNGMNNMMGYGFMNSGSAWFYSFAMLLLIIVWLLVGILAALWLWKQLKK